MKHLINSMFYIRLLVLATLTTSIASYGQRYSSTMLREDVAALNNTIVKAHPIMINQAYSNPLPEILDSLDRSEYQSYDFVEYHFQLRQILSKIGCYHTTVLPPKLPIQFSDKPHFPFKLWSDGVDIFLMEGTDPKEDIDSALLGTRVKAINGQNAPDILPSLLTFRPSDGPQNSNGIWHFNKYSTLLTREYFHNADSFLLELESGSIVGYPLSKTSSYGFERKFDALSRAPIFESGPIKIFRFKEHNEIAYIKISSFAYNDGQSTSEALLEFVDSEGLEHLVIDIRGNGGGRSNNAGLLASHFISDSFSGSDIVPKYQRGHKLGFSWARIGLGFWEAVNLGRKVTGDNGERQYPFTQNPAAQQFEGRVYVLVDGKTGSTASQFASLMQSKAGATIVGQETGGGYLATNAGSFAKYKLKSSKILVRFPLVRSGFNSDESDIHRGVVPNIAVEYDVKDIIEKKDKDLDAVIQHFRKKFD